MLRKIPQKLMDAVQNNGGVITVRSDQVAYIIPAAEKNDLKAITQGCCAALVAEWYRYFTMGRDFLKYTNSPYAHPDILNRLNTLYMAANDQQSPPVSENLKVLEIVRIACELKIKRIDYFNLAKTYGYELISACLQTNITVNGMVCGFKKDGAPVNNKMIPQPGLTLVKINNIDNFDSIANDLVDAHELGSLTSMSVVTVENSNAHAVGLTSYLGEDGSIVYKFYEPNYFECEFKAKKDLINFLSSYFGLFRELYHNNIDFAMYVRGLTLKNPAPAKTYEGEAEQHIVRYIELAKQYMTYLNNNKYANDICDQKLKIMQDAISILESNDTNINKENKFFKHLQDNMQTLARRRDSGFITFLKGLGVFAISLLTLGIYASSAYHSFFGKNSTQGLKMLEEYRKVNLDVPTQNHKW